MDVCVANILQGDMIALKDRLLGYVKPGGRLVLSGMVGDQVQAFSCCFHCDRWIVGPMGEGMR